MSVKKAKKKMVQPFRNYKWKAIFKDVGRFYLYLILLYAIAILLVWLQGIIELESYNTGMDEMMSDLLEPDYQALEHPKTFNFNPEYYSILMTYMREAMFYLACFGVFFSVPPKNLQHVAAVTAVISLTGFWIFLLISVEEWLYANAELAIAVLTSWMASHIWKRIKAHLPDEKSGRTH